MAKISTYSSDNNVTISDRLIGSDNENSNQTKNFLVGDIVNLAETIIVANLSNSFVPYSGATQGLDLGIYALSAEYVLSNTGISTNGSIMVNGNEGNVGDILVSQGSGLPPIWVNTPYLSAHSEVSQVAGLINTAYAMEFDQIDFADGISIVNDNKGDPTRITPDESGIYNFQFSAQIRRTTGGASATVDIWLRYGGIDIPHSNTSVNVQANAGYVVAAWNFFANVQITDPQPYIEIMWATTDTDVFLEETPATAVHPETPSIILTVNKVSQ